VSDVFSLQWLEHFQFDKSHNRCPLIPSTVSEKASQLVHLNHYTDVRTHKLEILLLESTISGFTHLDKHIFYSTHEECMIHKEVAFLSEILYLHITMKNNN